MPAVRMFGRKWRVSSDFLPLFAGVGLLFHSIWVIFIIVWPFGITNVHKCNNFKAGRHFQAAVCLFFGLYVLSFVQELLITVIGLRGTPLETRKRRFMNPVLYTQLVNWVGQLGVVSYGTYVTHTYSTAIVISYCSNASVVMLKVLVYSSWAMIAFNWGRLLVVYNLFPDYERVDSWAKRIRFYTWYSRSKNVITHLEKHRHRPLGRLAELYSRLLHGADLSPSDEFVSLVLLSAAQRKSRQEHIRSALSKYRQETSAAQQEANKPYEEINGKAPPPPPSNDPSQHPSQSQEPHARKSHSHRSSRSHPQTQSKAESQDQRVDCNGEAHSTHLEYAKEGIGDEMADTLSRIHTPNAADDRGMTGSPDQSSHQSPNQSLTASSAASPEASPDKESNHRDSHVIDMPSDRQHALPPPSCSASSVHGASPPHTKSSRQPASAKKADTQDLKDMEEGTQGTDDQMEQKMNGERNPGMQHGRMSSRRKLNQDEFFRKDFMLAPSSYACEYEPNIAPDKLADIYTGYKERVSRPEVTEAARFAKYAIAAYGAAGFQYLHQTSKVKNTYNLLKNRGKQAYKANKLMSSKIQSLEQHLDYEAIIQIAEIDDQDLLYLNFDNQALGEHGSALSVGNQALRLQVLYLIFDNQALGDLPYMLALDRPTKSVVLAIRGTVSVADLATDMLADPEPMEEWLPDTMTEEEESCIEQGPRRAHAGIMAAATAIWKDLRVHRILPALLNVSDSDDEDNPEYDIGA
ncbi:MAG: sn1-specific diacylglycerol lipase alpha, partial [Trebouxia sp. A1-2]